MLPKAPKSISMKLVWAVCLLTIPLAVWAGCAQPAPASAGFISGVKSLFQLPSEVDKLQNQYEDTKQQLDQATQQLDAASREAKESLQQFKESEQKLLQENERLTKQNETLQQSIAALQQAERERSDKYRKMVTLFATAIGLALLYFVLTRVLRVVLRTR